MSTLDALLPSNTTERRTLADLIFAKIDETETAGDSGNTAFINASKHGPSFSPFYAALFPDSHAWIDPDRRPDPAEGLNPKVVEVYTKYVINFRPL
jgi:essential nuclear protein 1